MNKEIKRLFTLAGCIACLFATTGCGAKVRPASYDIVVASDLHYITNEINDNGKYFTEMMAKADGKVSIYCEELSDAFLREVIQNKPEALILTGDISFNGARQSHEALARKLAEVEKAGVAVLVLPGNHDVFSSSAAIFHGEDYTRVYGIETQDFRDIYTDFGYNEAISQDDYSASYMYQLNDTTRVLMLDMNTADYFCGLSPDTLSWIEQQLKAAKKDGFSVLGCGHQNVLEQTFMTGGFTIYEAENLKSLLTKYGVELFLSGHIHMQHRKTENGLTEIASSSLSVAPCQYGVLKAQDGKIDYHTQPVNVSRWAQRQGREDNNLLDFAAFAQNYMDTLAHNQLMNNLYGRGVPREEKEVLVNYAVQSNRMFFAGDLTKINDLDPDGSILQRWVDTGARRTNYLAYVVEERGNDYTRWQNY